jgi:UDP-N-acetylmuramoyl-tripeptide--D-alanyl-D-alanine ligase
VAGITGSVGKTSSKDLAEAILARRYVATANEKSFNNELGVPLTLVSASPDTEVTIVEMGARGDGHIADLCAIARPTVAIVTAIELAHSEFMGGLDDIARAKGELVESLPAHGVALLNADNPRVAAMAERTSARSITFGVTGGDVYADNVVIEDDLRVKFDLHSEWGSASIRLGVRGVHHVGNALAAATLALLWDVPMADVVDGLEQAALSPWRMELHVSRSGVRVLNDAYNAGPASMEAALRAVAQLPTARHHAVLGPMAELGAESAAAHAHVASIASDLGIRLIAFGTDGYGSAAERTAHTIGDAVAALGDLGADDSVLVKGSRVAGLERLAAALLAD